MNIFPLRNFDISKNEAEFIAQALSRYIALRVDMANKCSRTIFRLPSWINSGNFGNNVTITRSTIIITFKEIDFILNCVSER